MDIKEYVGKRIRTFRLNRGLSQVQLAERLNTTKQAISRYELGERTANQDVLFDLANVFNVSVNEFFPGVNGDVMPSSTYIYYPSTIDNDKPFETKEKSESSTKEISVPKNVLGKYSDSDDLFFLKAESDSMNKVFPEGSLLGVKPTSIEHLKDGDIIIYRKSNRIIIKYFYRVDDKILLRPNSTNKDNIDIMIDDLNDLIIEGKVISYTVSLNN